MNAPKRYRAPGPFMFLTGYDTHDLLREWASVPALPKPTGEGRVGGQR
jgi:hypothetical protein